MCLQNYQLRTFTILSLSKASDPPLITSLACIRIMALVRRVLSLSRLSVPTCQRLIKNGGNSQTQVSRQTLLKQIQSRKCSVGATLVSVQDYLMSESLYPLITTAILVTESQGFIAMKWQKAVQELLRSRIGETLSRQAIVLIALTQLGAGTLPLFFSA